MHTCLGAGRYEAVWAEDAAAEWDAADGGEGTAGVLGAESVYSVLGRCAPARTL